jgi:two-component system sensor histidine kinase KdpD
LHEDGVTDGDIAISEPALRPAILVCIDARPGNQRLLRAAFKLAARLPGDGACVVAHIETGRSILKRVREREEILRGMTVGRQMGAETRHILAKSYEEGLARLLSGDSGLEIKGVVLGEGRREQQGRFGIFRRQSFADALRSVAPELKATFIRTPDKTRRAGLLALFRTPIYWRDMLGMTAILIATMLFVASLSLLLRDSGFSGQVSNVKLFFVLAVVVISGRFGALYGLTAALISSLYINYRFVDPANGLTPSKLGDVVGLALFLLTGLTAAAVGGYTRALVAAAEERERRGVQLAELSRGLAPADSPAAVAALVERHTETMLRRECVLLSPEIGGTMFPGDAEFAHGDKRIDDAALAALALCREDHQTAGAGTARQPFSDWRFEPVRSGETLLAVLAIDFSHGPSSRETSLAEFFGQIADQAALALERILAEAARGEAKFTEERERLRSMLLSAVSHDLKTPLASIIGSLSAIREMRERLSAETVDMLLDTALEEAERLNHFISNILDMTRLESDVIKLRRDWADPVELLRDTAHRLRHRLAQHLFAVESRLPGPTEIDCDELLAGQVLQNVLDNAVKYTPPGSRIAVALETDDAGFHYIVSDNGPGVPESHRESIFDKYARLEARDSRQAGTGLGLAICRSIMRAHGGDITLSASEADGARFDILFPAFQAKPDASGGEAA